jgi:prepilin-type N-terminal cleavage/methylation domain-containing protein
LTHRSKNNTIKAEFSGATGSSVNTHEIRTPLKEIAMRRNQRGFTLIEITVVLVLMAIISAYVIGRSFVPEQIDLAAQTEKIRNQIRYTQAAAMKQSDTIWGITSNTSNYWVFRRDTDLPVMDTPVILPGERNAQITLADSGIDSLNAFTLFFDRIGKPYSAYDKTTVTPLVDPLTITVSVGTQSRSFRVLPETGLVQ